MPTNCCWLSVTGMWCKPLSDNKGTSDAKWILPRKFNQLDQIECDNVVVIYGPWFRLSCSIDGMLMENRKAAVAPWIIKNQLARSPDFLMGL